MKESVLGDMGGFVGRGFRGWAVSGCVFVGCEGLG